MKPANVKITLEGTVKVLDLGLAKALTMRATHAGMTTESARMACDRQSQAR